MAQDNQRTPSMGTNVEPSMIARAISGIRYAATGQVPEEWFGPLRAMIPVVPANQVDSVTGRQMDYSVGYNMRITPRQDEPTSFAQMRALADACDVLRLVIESRKDQLAKIEWTIKPIDDKVEPDARCQEVLEFMHMPDKENNWTDWLRMMLEDMFVVDAASIYVRPTLAGRPYSFELVDGATVLRKIDARGRTPAVPEVAYQQVFKGMPAVDYTSDELIYAPRNKRTHKVYGYSQVEQIIMTVNTALRRSIYQLQYYTEGSTPDLMFSVPSTWNPDQVRNFKLWWDEVLLGNTGARRGTMFVPDGISQVNTKEAILKDEYDEWLARIVCYAFSVSPGPFVKEQNRATAATAADEAHKEGLLPAMMWVKNTINLLIWKTFGYKDITFDWKVEEATNALVKAQVSQIYIANKVQTPDEVRLEMGLEPMTPEERATAFPAPVVMNSPDGTAQNENDKNAAPKPTENKPVEAGKIFKSKKSIRRISRDRKQVLKCQETLNGVYLSFFKDAAKSLAGQVVELLGKAELTAEEQVAKVLEQLDLSDFAILVTDSEEALTLMAQDGAITALAQIGIKDPDVVSLANEKAIAFAKERAAELVGMKWIDGELVDNPNAEWSIAETTREGLRSLVANALENGDSNDVLSSAIEDSYLFSDARSMMIARTETATADVQGNMIAYRASGVVSGKRWITADDDLVSEDCAMNGEAGVIDIDGTFPSGAAEPPEHPNCRCDVVPVLIDDEKE